MIISSWCFQAVYKKIELDSCPSHKGRWSVLFKNIGKYDCHSQKRHRLREENQKGGYDLKTNQISFETNGSPPAPSSCFNSEAFSDTHCAANARPGGRPHSSELSGRRLWGFKDREVRSLEDAPTSWAIRWTLLAKKCSSPSSQHLWRSVSLSISGNPEVDNQMGKHLQQTNTKQITLPQEVILAKDRQLHRGPITRCKIHRKNRKKKNEQVAYLGHGVFPAFFFSFPMKSKNHFASEQRKSKSASSPGAVLWPKSQRPGTFEAKSWEKWKSSRPGSTFKTSRPLKTLANPRHWH